MLAYLQTSNSDGVVPAKQTQTEKATTTPKILFSVHLLLLYSRPKVFDLLEFFFYPKLI